MKLVEICESVEQQRTVSDPKDVQQDKHYVHTSAGDDEAVVWGSFDQDEAKRFLSHSRFTQDKSIAANIMKGQDIIQQDIL